MDRVQIAVIALAVGILMFWFLTTPEPAPRSTSPIPTAGFPSAAAPGPPAPSAEGAGTPGGLSEPGPGRLLTQSAGELTHFPTIQLENDALRIRVSTRGGRLTGIELKHYNATLDESRGPVDLVTLAERGTLLVFLGDGPFSGLERSLHSVVRSGEREVELAVEGEGVRVTRTLSLDPSGYGARLRIRVENVGETTLRPTFQLAWYGQADEIDGQDRFHNYGLVAMADGEVERGPLRAASPLGCAGGSGGPKEGEFVSPVEWAGMDSQYFMAVAIPETPQAASAYHGPLGRVAGQSVLSYPTFELPPGGQLERQYRLYLGPKDRQAVRVVDARLEPAVQVGWSFVRPLVDLFVSLLGWTYANLVGNYGVAIILVTIMVRVATFPLTQRSMQSMQRVSLVAPEMKVLQEKYKGDKARLQQEMMALYKRKGMNPLTSMGGGCILMLIQMPFLLGLYFALQSSIELRHAPFALWIQDLSSPEDFFAIAGIPIRPLPLLMGVSMVLQQRLTPAPNADPQQRQMMTWMSVFFIFLFYSFASGLVLYWFVSNLLAIGQQMLIRRKNPPPEAGR